MLNKIAIGTANFVHPYGILSKGKLISRDIVISIFDSAIKHNINTFDTAFAYGDFLGVLRERLPVSSLKIITKFSVLDNYEDVLCNMRFAKEQHYFDGYYGLLVHDPQNLEKADKGKLLNLFDNLYKQNLVKKIGVSVYDFNDLDNFKRIMNPQLIQIPLNPVNQVFINDDFLDYIAQRDIEVHTRSLFLQGVLLSNKLPKSLNELEPLFRTFIESCRHYRSQLEALLSWAFAQEWVNKWVLGVSSLEDLLGIIKHTQNFKNIEYSGCFDVLKNTAHPLTDPRNWKILEQK